ncbi:hypothetical protein [Lacrimispora indolis]|uniref:hypothetical protein n=1 Tax=Lacrimispora indolis TaxID=69825 RepID=UPI00045E71F8|nr:hypothetical protein [Lacrimispora indolis]
MRYEPEHFYFDFNYLERKNISHEEVKKYTRWVDSNFSKLCNNGWDSHLNVEWIIRTYKSAKMVMASTLMLNTASYCIEHNAFIAVPYLLYYALFNISRSLVFVDPHQPWSSIEKLSRISHSKLSTITKDIIAKLNLNLSFEIYTKIEELRNDRELFSYAFPANGYQRKIVFENVVGCCGIVAELAELTGFRIQNYIEKHYLKTEEQRQVALNTWQKAELCDLVEAYTYSSIIDSEDLYRIDYIKRKRKFPASIIFTLTEGMTEDFFGAWLSENDEILSDDYFKPDINWNIIYPIP